MFRRTIRPGVELAPLEERHAEEIFRLIDDNREHLRPWMPWLDGAVTVESAKEFVRDALEQQEKGEGLAAGIFVDGALAGLASYTRIDLANRSGAIGYWIGEVYQGRGLVTQACQALADYGFEELGLNRVEIRAATANRRSCAVPERLGFTREGVERQASWMNDRFHDVAIYSVLRDEWYI